MICSSVVDKFNMRFRYILIIRLTMIKDDLDLAPDELVICHMKKNFISVPFFIVNTFFVFVACVISSWIKSSQFNHFFYFLWLLCFKCV